MKKNQVFRSLKSLILTLILIFNFYGCSTSNTTANVIKPGPHLELGEEYQKEAGRLLGLSKEQYNAALSDPSMAPEARLRLAGLYFQEGEYGQCIDLLNKAEKLPPEFLRLCALSNFRLNRLPQAKRAFEELGTVNARDIEAIYYMGLIDEQQNVFEEAILSYQKVIDLAPDSDYGRLAVKNLKDLEAQGITHIDLMEDIEIKNLIKQSPNSDAYPNAGAAILLDEVIITVNENNTQTNTVHKIIKILDDRGKDFGEIELGYDSTYQSVQIDFARTIKADGSIIPVSKKSWREVSPWSGFPLYSNVKMMVISMPEVVVGSIIEYQATITSSHLITDEDFQFTKSLQMHEPNLIQRVSFTVPASRSWQTHWLKPEIINSMEINPKIIENGKMRTYLWEIKNVPQLIPEPMMPPWADILPYLMVSSFDSWEEISKWFSGLIGKQLDPDEAIKLKTAELIAGRHTQRERAQEIFHWIISQVRYVGLEYGVSGYKPHNVVDIFKNKYGDCKDQSSLLVSMLREAKIKASLVLINTQDSGQVVKDIPMLQFNHCIAVAEIDGDLIWLDPTYRTCTFGYLPPADQDRNVLVFFDSGARFVKTPFFSADENVRKDVTQLTINTDGSVLGHSRMTTSGLYNMEYRNLKYVIPVKREEMLQNITNEAFPGGQLISYNFLGLEDLAKPIEITMDYNGPNYLKKAGNLRMFQLPGVGGSAGGVGLEKRNYPIYFSSASTSHSETEIKIPYNLRVRNLPEEVQLDLPAVYYSSKYTPLNENTILHTEIYKVKGQEIPVDGYQEYKLFREKIAKASEESIILEEIPAE